MQIETMAPPISDLGLSLPPPYTLLWPTTPPGSTLPRVVWSVRAVGAGAHGDVGLQLSQELAAHYWLNQLLP